MKTVLVVVALVLLTASLVRADDGGMPVLPAGRHSIVAPVELAAARHGDRVFLVAGKETSTSQKTAGVFGIMLSKKGTNPLSRPLIEILNAADRSMLRTITAGDLLGTGSAGWKPMPAESNAAAGKAVSVFSFNAMNQVFRFYRTVELTADEHLPGGRAMAVSFALGGEKPASVIGRFLGESSGALGIEGSTVLIGDEPTEQASQVFMVIHAGGAASVSATGTPKKGEPRGFTIESRPTECTPGARAVILSLVIAGTTVEQPGTAARQAHNLLTYLDRQTVKPEVVALTAADHPNTNPGDTVLYTIVYHNIGTAPGTDVEINNPVPIGTRYIENTAEGDRGTVGLDRSAGDVVTAIQWKINTPILPGEQHSVRFEVLVQ